MRLRTTAEIALLTVILLGIIWYAVQNPVSVQAPGSSTSMDTSTSPAGPYVEDTKYYRISVDIPEKTTLPARSNDAARTSMRNYLLGVIAEFKANGNFTTLTPEDEQMMGYDRGRKQELQVTYEIKSSPRTATYVYTIYEDTFGAHGNIYFHTFTFDTTSGAELKLTDIFTPGSDYLDALSGYARTQLPQILGTASNDEFIAIGTTPVLSNFENFFFEDRELVILFPPYQVAAYAAGPQKLRIPTASLSTLRPEFR
jgi:hypothetical protein